MRPATTSERYLDETRLLVINSDNEVTHTKVKNLNDFFSPGDLLVVNRSATLPSRFQGVIERSGEHVEIRLASFQGPSPQDLSHWLAISFGLGSWRTPTEKRAHPPQLISGDVVAIGAGLKIFVSQVEEGRLLRIQFQSDALEEKLYQYGRPIQYSYLKEDLKLWDQQTIFSGPPVSVEPPSASFQMTWSRVLGLKKMGVEVFSLIHGAGISSTGSESLDKKLPLKEWYSIPFETAKAVHEARTRGKKVIALGTTVLRALESASYGGVVSVGDGLTSLKIKSDHKFQVVDALVSGVHESGTSHLELLKAFIPESLLDAGYRQMKALEYRGHEYGDLSLLIR